jgi:hypothetical protein
MFYLLILVVKTSHDDRWHIFPIIPDYVFKWVKYVRDQSGGNCFSGELIVPTMQNYGLKASVVLLSKLYIISLISVVQLNITVCCGPLKVGFRCTTLIEDIMYTFQSNSGHYSTLMNHQVSLQNNSPWMNRLDNLFTIITDICVNATLLLVILTNQEDWLRERPLTALGSI